MKYLSALTVSMLIVSASLSVNSVAIAQTPQQECAIGYVTGIGGAVQNVREYLALPDRDKYRYLADNPINCSVSDEGRASACTGLTSFRNDKVSVYDDIDNAVMAVVARVELDQGTYPAIIAVPRPEVKCEE